MVRNIIGLAVLLCCRGVSADSAGTVPWGYAAAAEANGVPAEVLYAIALTESGRTIAPGRLRPWPWTLNVRGRPERFVTRAEAHAALIRYLEKGITLIDVGLMQVNWHHHQHRLGTPWAALEPYHNIRVGSRILLEEYRRTGNWREAIGRYHAPGRTPKRLRRAEQYRQRVGKHLATLGEEAS